MSPARLSRSTGFGGSRGSRGFGGLVGLALLVLLVVQAALGVRDEWRRALRTPLADRAAALGSRTDWRYRNVLGPDYALLLSVRAHARPESVVLLVHDGTPDAVRRVEALAAVLSPLVVRTLVPPRDGRQLAAPAKGDALLVHFGGAGPLSATLAGSGWHALESSAPAQLWSTRPTLAGARTAPLPGNDPQTTTRMDAWRLALLVALPLLSGCLWLLAVSLRPRDAPLAFWGWAWMTGCVWIGLLLLGWLLLGQSPRALGPATWSLLCLPLPLLAALFAAWFPVWVSARSARRRSPPARPEPPVALDAVAPAPPAPPAASARWERWVFALSLGFALAVLGDRIVLSSAEVIAGGDEGTIWTAKARALWEADGWTARYAEVVQRDSGIWHQDYPPLNPLLQLFAAGLAERPLDFENRLPVQLMLPALVLALAGALRRCTRPAIAGLLLVVFITCRTTTNAVGVAHSDGLLACGLLLLLEALSRWGPEPGAPRWGWLALAGTAATLLVFSKNEGAMLLLAAGVGWAAGRRARRDARLRAVHALWLAPALLVLVAQVALNRRFGFVNDLFATPDGSSLLERLVQHGAARVGPLLGALGDYLLTGERETRLLVAAFVALLLLFPRRMLFPRGEHAGPDRSAWSRTVLLAMCGFLLVYLGSYWDVVWHMRWSLPRLMFQLLPSLIVALGAASTGLGRERPA